MSANLLTRGTLFAGRYRVERSIGAGGMGAVFEAEHVETERRVALKVLLPQSLLSESARERFKQEARVAGKIRHPHIVDVLDAGVDDATGLPYLAMELLHGEDLGSRIDRLGPMSAEETVALLAQIASALDCLHERSIVHRDLKPENLFMTWSDDGSRVMKLLDFGVAKVIADGASALTQDAQGTPVYMAPEQFAEQIRISRATDIYAIGMVAFTLLTGKHYWGPEIERGMNVFMLARVAEGGPKEPATTRAARQGISLPAAFDEWFSIVTAMAPNERYPTAGDAIETLADALGVALTAQLSAGAAPRSEEAPAPPPSSRAAAPPPAATGPDSQGTPALPLRRGRPFWRRPMSMAATVLGVGCVAAYAMLWKMAAPGPTNGRQGSNGLEVPTSSAAASLSTTVVSTTSSPQPGASSASSVEPSPSATVSASAVASSAVASSASASAASPQVTAPVGTPTGGIRTNGASTRTHAKPPKYTRE